MKFFDVGDQAVGVIAIGQQATGFFALGQLATGVIAIGQLSRGVIAIGQLAVGLVGWGQVGAGIFHAVGMVGVGGRRGIGAIIPIIPSIGRPRAMPPAIDLSAVEAGNDGWVEVDLTRDELGLGLYLHGRRLPVKLDRRLQHRGAEIIAEGPVRVRAYTRRIGAILVADRIAWEPPRPYQKKSFAGIATLQIAALLVCGFAWAGIAGHDIGHFLGNMVSGAEDAPVKKPAPAPSPRPKRR